MLLGMLLLLVQDDKEAERLLQAVRDRVDQAKTVRVEYATTGVWGEWTCVIKTKGNNRWSYSVSVVRGGSSDPRKNTGSLVSDGRKVLGSGCFQDPRHGWLDCPDQGVELRRSLSLGWFQLSGIEWNGTHSPPAKVASVKGLGRAILDEREVRVIEYVLKYQPVFCPGVEHQVKLFLKPDQPIPLKREIFTRVGTWTEDYTVFAVDEEIPDSEFSLQSSRKLAKALTGQLARSVELFGRFTGYHPRALEELVRRPGWLEPEIFWPDGGFLLGGVLPKDPWGGPFDLRTEKSCVWVVSLGADRRAGGKGDGEDILLEVPAVTRRSTGAPTERLQKQFTARVQLHLLSAAVRGFFEAYGERPRRKAALWERPDWVECWPEGGWIPGGLPADPWNEPYRIVSDSNWVRVQVKDPRARAIATTEITPELRRQLEEISRPRFSKEELADFAELFDRLRHNSLLTREQAEQELRGWGSTLLSLLEERLRTETDPEALWRLMRLSRGISRSGAGWAHELAPLTVTVVSGDMTANERAAVDALKTIAAAQADFRSCDRDGNDQRDFWTGDVAGLYAIGDAIKLFDLSIALADQNATSGTLTNGKYSKTISSYGLRCARDGYWFRALGQDLQTLAEGGNGAYAQDTDGTKDLVHNTCKFGVCAIPEAYGVTGTKVFILNEDNTIFWRDFGADVFAHGASPPALSGVWTPDWPTDATRAASWNKLE